MAIHPPFSRAYLSSEVLEWCVLHSALISALMCQSVFRREEAVFDWCPHHHHNVGLSQGLRLQARVDCYGQLETALGHG